MMTIFFFPCISPPLLTVPRRVPRRLSLQLEPQAQSPAQSSSSRESAEERDRVSAAVPPSPARQAAVQAHRRACSLGVK